MLVVREGVEFLRVNLRCRKGLPNTNSIRVYENFEEFLQLIDMSQTGVGSFSRQLHKKYSENIFINGVDWNPSFYLQLREEELEPGNLGCYYFYSHDGDFCGVLPTGLNGYEEESDADNREEWKSYGFGINFPELEAESRRLQLIKNPTVLDILAWVSYMVKRNTMCRTTLEECADWYKAHGNMLQVMYDGFAMWKMAKTADAQCLTQAKVWRFCDVENRTVSYDTHLLVLENGMQLYRCHHASDGFYFDRKTETVLCNYCSAPLDKGTPRVRAYHKWDCLYASKLNGSRRSVHDTAKCVVSRKT